ncbi:hypothetical protein [uncultured Tenacibaculum sp.]|uniref:hypothetical protein n=1 Tax=uncultured Tenacibaculum sp. TaxID=174713 RepID=UPI00260B1ACE|nr:hypothetical protein [uncultured Tenacibaculum sp.]
MKINLLEIFLKLIWLAGTIFTIFILGSITFILLTFGNIGEEKYNFWNLTLPHILTIGILLAYTKEILKGYKPKSARHNLISLIIFSVLIITIVWALSKEFKLIFKGDIMDYWAIFFSYTIIFTTYIGIIVNRIQILKRKHFTKE